MNNSSTFQTVIKVVFGALILVAVIAFIAIKPKSSSQKAGLAGKVSVWGTIPKAAVMAGMSVSTTLYPDLDISYQQIPEESFDNTLVDALASGGGPDLVILPSTELLRQRNRIETIPFTTYSRDQYDKIFADGASSFVLPWGIGGLPIGIDPMVMYYNRDLLSSAFVVNPVVTWQDFDIQNSSLTQINGTTGQINQSMVALGATGNVPNYSDILSLLILQSGGSITKFDGEKFTSALRLGSGGDITRQPTPQSLEYFMSFTNPESSRYTWTTGKRDARQAFIASELVYYIGYASEYNTIRKLNPNLNFDITLVPQPEGTKTKMTMGRVYGIAMTKNSQQKALAFSAMNILATPEVNAPIIDSATLAPALRSELAKKQEDKRKEVINNSAIISRSFWVPDSKTYTEILSSLINTAQSGIVTTGEAISRADASLSAELMKMRPPQSAVATPAQ